MAIRIEHQPSGAAVGMAAYAAGLGRARQRQQKDAMAMWEEEQRRPGNRYRQAMGVGQIAQQRGQQIAQPQGTWEDPFALAQTPEDRVRINSQRRANEQALRLGKPIPYPEATMQFRPAPTKEEIQRGYDLQDENRKRQQQSQDEAAKITLGDAKARYDALMGQFEAIGSGGRESWSNPDNYYRVRGNLEAGRKDQAGPKHLLPVQHYNAAIEELEGFMSGHKSTDLKPPELRPGYERVTPDGRLIRRGLDGKDEDAGPAPWHMLNPDQQRAREANRESNTVTVGGRKGQYRWDRYGEYFDPFPEPKAVPSPIDQRKEWQRQYKMFSTQYDIDHPDATQENPQYIKDRDKWARSQVTVQVGGGDSAPAAPGAPTSQPQTPPSYEQQQAALPIAWAKTPQGMVPIDGFGKGPIGIIGGSDPTVYVMADGRQVTAPKDAQQPAAARGGGAEKIPLHDPNEPVRIERGPHDPNEPAQVEKLGPAQPAGVAMTKDEAVRTIKLHTASVKSGDPIAPELSQRAAEAASWLEGKSIPVGTLSPSKKHKWDGTVWVPVG